VRSPNTTIANTDAVCVRMHVGLVVESIGNLLCLGVDVLDRHTAIVRQLIEWDVSRHIRFGLFGVVVVIIVAECAHNANRCGHVVAGSVQLLDVGSIVSSYCGGQAGQLLLVHRYVYPCSSVFVVASSWAS
jgi:hypothetical protein